MPNSIMGSWNLLGQRRWQQRCQHEQHRDLIYPNLRGRCISLLGGGGGGNLYLASGRWGRIASWRLLCSRAWEEEALAWQSEEGDILLGSSWEEEEEMWREGTCIAGRPNSMMPQPGGRETWRRRGGSHMPILLQRYAVEWRKPSLSLSLIYQGA